MEWQRKNKASIHRTAQLHCKFIQATRLSTVKLSTANVDRLQQRWTHQLLRGSALLPRPSTLKLAILPLTSGASLRLARSTLGDASRFGLVPPPPPSLKLLYSQVQGLCGGIAAHEERSQHPQNCSYFSIEGGRNHERKCRIPRISPPCALY